MGRVQGETDDHLGFPVRPDRSLRFTVFILAVPRMGAVVKYSVPDVVTIGE